MFITKRELREIRARLERLEEIVASPASPAPALPPVKPRAGEKCAADSFQRHSFDGNYICHFCGLKAASAQ